MIQFTTIRHSDNNWILIRHTELVDQCKRELVATFNTSNEAIESEAYIASALPAAYKTIYSSNYRGYWINVTRKVVCDNINGILNVRSCYVGFVSVDNSPIYLDYLTSSKNEYICTEWRTQPDTINNLKWFVKTQLPILSSCLIS
jgi:hypothetical protein